MTLCPATDLSALSTPKQRVRAIWINAALWTSQGLLAMFYVAAGYAKLSEPMRNLVFLMGWPEQVTETFVRSFGAAELALGLMMLAPVFGWKFGRPFVVISAAVLAVMQIAFLGLHLARFEFGFSVLNLLLLGITVPVLLGRRCRSS